MNINKIEIYPYHKKNEVKLKNINTNDIICDANMSYYIHNKYVQLFDENIIITKIITEVLQKIMEITNSKDSFISIVNKDIHDKLYLKYYCVLIENKDIKFNTIMENNMIPFDNDNLMTRAVINNFIVISNNMSADPRSSNINNNNYPPNHININTFMAIPLNKDGNVIGQIGLANSNKYKISTVFKIISLMTFLSNFIYLSMNNKLSSIKNIELYNEVSILKSSFIATMSHEIRTPLNGVVGMARLLSLSNNLTEKQKEYIHILSECSIQLMELVNDILDYSKITSGYLVFNKQDFNLKESILKVKDLLYQRVKDKNLDLIINFSDDLPEKLNGDIRRINQVLINLLTNAIKFTNEGYIKLNVDIENISISENSNNNKIIFTITDTGIGIKEKDIKRIFEVFTKLNDDDIYTNTTPGAGIGLALCKYIVEKMNGEINVSSNGEKGTIFTFYIILEDETDIKQLLDLHISEFNNKKILILDENEDDRIYLFNSLYNWKMNVISFSNHREMLNYIEKYSDTDIIIIDTYISNISGLELVQTIRDIGYNKPIIGVTSLTKSQNSQYKEWFDNFITKPISRSTLFNILLKYFIEDDKKNNVIKCKRSISSTKSDINILIVEDDPYNQILLEEMLICLGYNNINIVSNGQMSIEEIKKKSYDLCFMDIKMPVMDGLTATRIIKKSSSSPYIIGVSASVLDSDKNKCYAAGMDGYIPKPIQISLLKTILQNFT